MKSGNSQEPVTIGLSECPDSPNCVSSVTMKPGKRVLPLPWKGDLAKTQDCLQRALVALGDAKIVEKRDRYWKAECKTKWVRFIDDVEFLFDEKNQRVDVRSASRLGRYDFQANLKRVDRLRLLMTGAP